MPHRSRRQYRTALTPPERAPHVRRRTHPARGFTLIEVLIVTAIIAILATIAYPSYTDSIDRSRRADAKAALLQNAQILERCYTRTNSYDHEDCSDPPEESPDGHYDIDNDIADDGRTFTLTATPKGVQTRDKDKCEELSLDHRGSRTAKGSLGDDCW